MTETTLSEAPAVVGTARTSTPKLTVSVQKLAKSYGRREVLTDVTFDVPRGVLLGIQGENGAGKSTLLKCLVGLIKPDRGQVEVHGTVGLLPPGTGDDREPHGR